MLYFGGDYNPEQWPREVWAEDLELMRQGRVNLVTVAVFSWSRLEPRPGEFDFGWLDEVLDGLHRNGIGVCLATPTASPPPWFTRSHPDAMPVTREGIRLGHGSRDTYCVNAPAYRSASVRIAAALSARYGTHPALKLWHVHNEYGTWCFCDHCAVAFRSWQRARHGSLEALNARWSTDFWSQRYGDWEEILPPRATQYLRNPAQELDYRRFLSASFTGHYAAQREQLRGNVAVTTNFVLGQWVPVDHARFATEVDLVAIDHYPHSVETSLGERAFVADLARGWARAAGHPDGRWLLMEHAPGAVHDGVLRSLEPGGLSAAARSYVDRGSVGVMYFQWRASRGGAEQWHPAMVPHEGPSSPVFTELCSLGAALADQSPVAVTADVAVIYDEESMWAWRSEHLPTRHVDYETVVRQWHNHLASEHGNVDVIPPWAPLDSYRLVVVPALYLMSAATHAALRSYTGKLVITSGSAVADEHARITPGSLDDLIGARITGRTFNVAPGELWVDHVEPVSATAVGSDVFQHGNVTFVARLAPCRWEERDLNNNAERRGTAAA